MAIHSAEKVARITAIASTFLMMGIEFLFAYQSSLYMNWQSTLIKSVIVGLFVYLLLLYLLRMLLSARLGNILKLIRVGRKSGIQATSVDTMLDNAEKEVQEWSQNRLDNVEKEQLLKRYRQEFTGNISHELKTPLFSIEGYVHTLLEGAMHDPVITKKYLKKAADNVDRLTEILDAMSTISQFESGQLILDRVDFNINEVLQDCIEELRYLVEDRKANISLPKGEFLNVKVNADPKYIRQVFINLISNSVRYGKKKGKVCIEYNFVGKDVLIEVIDDGPGIAEEHLPFLFDRFYRVDAGRSRKEGGSGIGLAIVKHILDAHDQSINVSSEVGKGSNFKFTLLRA